jgi:hypothetical protein
MQTDGVPIALADSTVMRFAALDGTGRVVTQARCTRPSFLQR